MTDTEPKKGVELFSAPAMQDDFTDPSRDPEQLSESRQKFQSTWHDRVVDAFAKYSVKGSLRKPYPRFYSPIHKEVGTISTAHSISWNGFPRLIDTWKNVAGDQSPQNLDDAYRLVDRLQPVTIANVSKDGAQRVTVEPYIPGFNHPMRWGNRSGPEFLFLQRQHDEYLEWFVEKTPDGKIKCISLTAESPEYWSTLAEVDIEVAVYLYRKHVNSNINQTDIVFPDNVSVPFYHQIHQNRHYIGHTTNPDYGGRSRGDYNPWNKWNVTHGAAHLVHRSNSLVAEIDLAASSTQRFEGRETLGDAASPLDIVASLENASANRASDPTISYQVNSLVLGDRAASISNPVGLYIGEFNLSGLQDPNGRPIEHKAVKVTRGGMVNGKPMILRLEIAVPNGENYSLDECTLDGVKLQYGGQIARNILVTIHAESLPSGVGNPVVNRARHLCEHENRPGFFVLPRADVPCGDVTETDWKIAAPYGGADPSLFTSLYDVESKSISHNVAFPTDIDSTVIRDLVCEDDKALAEERAPVSGFEKTFGDFRYSTPIEPGRSKVRE